MVLTFLKDTWSLRCNKIQGLYPCIVVADVDKEEEDGDEEKEDSDDDEK